MLSYFSRIIIVCHQRENNYAKKKNFDTNASKSTIHLVGMAGFEPAVFCSQSRRGNQAALHPEMFGAPDKIRTRDPQIRSLILYPAELLAHFATPREIAYKL